MKYNLEERTFKFSEQTIIFLKTININLINKPLISQLIRSATSIGANYCEANGAISKKDFKNKICICKKEAKETKYWLQLLSKTNNDEIFELRNLWREAHELTLIFSRIIITIDNSN